MGLGWMGLGWDLCVGLFYEHRFAMLKIPSQNTEQFFEKNNVKKDDGNGGQAFFWSQQFCLIWMEINLEFFAKVKAIKLHCCFGSGFISDRNDIASTWIRLKYIHRLNRLKYIQWLRNKLIKDGCSTLVVK